MTAFSHPTAAQPPGGLVVLGRRTVARIGYGSIQLEAGDDRDAVAILRRAVELGVNHLDTAQFYAAGRVNARIRAALHPYPEDLVLVSKVGATSQPDAPHGLRPAQTPRELRAEVHANLTELGVDHLDVVNLFPMARSREIPVQGGQVVDLDDQLAELRSMRDDGLIGGIGLSHVDTATLRDALPAGIACVQNAYSLVNRSSDQVREACQQNDVAWVPYGPLRGASPGLPNVTDTPAVRTTAKRLGASPAQIGLAWLLANGPQTVLIPGTRTVSHLEDNLAAGNVTLDDEALAVFGNIGLPPDPIGPDPITEKRASRR